MPTSRLPLLLLVCLLLPSCAQEPAPPAAAGPLRIVSLAPALTKMVADLGLLDQLVGVAQHDPVAPPATPVVGNYIDTDVERLLATNPTDVMTMVGKEGVPPRLRELARDGRFRLHVYPVTVNVEDVKTVVQQLGFVLGKLDESSALVQSMDSQLEAIQQAAPADAQPRVLLVIGLDPVMASGPGVVHDELLGRIGAVNVAANAAVTAPTYDREALLGMQPDVILLLLPDAPPLRPGDPRLAGIADLDIPAVNNDRVVLLNDPLILLPSTNLPDIARQMAEAVYQTSSPESPAGDD